MKSRAEQLNQTGSDLRRATDRGIAVLRVDEREAVGQVGGGKIISVHFSTFKISRRYFQLPPYFPRGYQGKQDLHVNLT